MSAARSATGSSTGASGRGALLPRRRPPSRSAAAPAGPRRHVDPFERVVEQELVARGRQQRRGRVLDPHADHPLVQLAELVDERGEVAVARADHERRDVVALERHLHRVDGHLDVARVLARGAHALRDLDQLDLPAREHAAVLVEGRPVRVRLAGDHPAALGERIEHRLEIERQAAEGVPRPDGQVLVVQEERDPFLVGVHGATLVGTRVGRCRIRKIANFAGRVGATPTRAIVRPSSMSSPAVLDVVPGQIRVDSASDATA